MGYYTKFDLKINTKINQEQELQITNFLSNKIIKKSVKISDHWDDYLEEEMKWYDYETDMTELSILFPDIVFELSGEGEESDDIWKQYFKSGKTQICNAIISFDKFDEAKLT